MQPQAEAEPDPQLETQRQQPGTEAYPGAEAQLRPEPGLEPEPQLQPEDGDGRQHWWITELPNISNSLAGNDADTHGPEPEPELQSNPHLEPSLEGDFALPVFAAFFCAAVAVVVRRQRRTYGAGYAPVSSEEPRENPTPRDNKNERNRAGKQLQASV